MPTSPAQMIQLAQTLAQTRIPAQVQEQQNFDGEINSINRDYGLADALAQQQYIPNSGILGALAQAVSGLSSHYVGKRADKKAGEVGAKVEAQRQAAEAARAEAEAQKQAEQYAREDAREQAKQAASMARIQAQEDARNKRHAEKLAADAAKGQGGGAAKAHDSPYGNQMQALVDAGIVSTEEAAKAARLKAGLDQPAAAQKPLSADAKNKVALLNNAIANAKKYRAATFGEGGEFRDIDSRLGATPQLLKSAVQDSLYVKTGASAPAEEVAKAEAMYLPSTVLGVPTERDSTTRSKVDNFINDMTAMRESLLGGGQAASEPARSDAPTSAPAVGAVKNGYRFKGGDPAKRESWEKV